MTAKSKTSAQPAEDERRDVEDALLDYVSEMAERMFTAADNSSPDVVSKDLHARLRESAPDVADIAIDTATQVLGRFRAQMSSVLARRGEGDPRFVGRAIAGQLGDVLIEVLNSRTDASSAAVINAAQREVERITDEQADTLAQLQKAVDVADLDSIMQLRPRVEVTLPISLSKARLAVLDARLQATDATSDADGRRLAAASAIKLQAAEDALEQAKSALTIAESKHGLAAVIGRQVSDAAKQQSTHRDALEQERDNLARGIEREQERLVRRLAGLDEPAPTVASQPEEPTTVINAGVGQRENAFTPTRVDSAFTTQSRTTQSITPPRNGFAVGSVIA